MVSQHYNLCLIVIIKKVNILYNNGHIYIFGVIMRKNLFIVIGFVFFTFFSLTGCGGATCFGCYQYSPEVIMDSNDGGIAANENNVSLAPNIVLKFNQTIAPGTISTQNIFLSSIPLANNVSTPPQTELIPITAITSNPDNNTFSFHPANPLTPKTTYYVTVSGTIGMPNSPTNAPVNVQFMFSTENSIFPTVSIISPENGAQNISTIPNIAVQFSEPVTHVNSSNIIIYKGSLTGPSIPISSIIAGTNNTYNIISKIPLNSLTTYYVSLNNQITDLNGNSLNPKSFSFTTGSNLNPSVNILYPTNNSIDISISPIIQLQFSKTVKNVNSQNIVLTAYNSGNTVPISSITSGDNNTYMFVPVNQLESDTTYAILVKNNITDESGDQVINSTFYFTTGSDTAPTVSMISPSNNASNVPNLPTIQLQFSQTVQNVNSPNIMLYESSPQTGNIIPFTIAVESSNIYALTPSSILDSATTFYVVISNGVSGTNGTSIVPITFSFTTIDKKYIFVTTSAFTGDLKAAGGGATSNNSADILCNRDSAKPDSGNYQSMILSNERSPANLDTWILQTNTNYYNLSDQIIGATNSSATFNFPLTNAISTVAANVWTGASSGNPWELAPGGSFFYCQNWTDATISNIGYIGEANATNSDLMSINIINTCSQAAHLYCVEQ